MNLYIMSRGRAGKVTTLKHLPESLRDKTWLVVPVNEYGDYANSYPGVNIVVSPHSIENYSQKFQWILDGFPINGPNGLIDYLDDKAVILDDDLVFSKFSNGHLLTVRDNKEVESLFEFMEELLDVHPLVGVAPRQHAQETPEGYKLNGRLICIQGINRRLIGEVKVDVLPILADVILNCHLLSRGQSTALITTHFQDHGPCQAPGGCSIYRTAEMQQRAAEYIANRFGPFAKVVIRKPKVAKWLGEEGRVEFTVQWKKLYEYGKKQKEKFGEEWHGL